LPTGKLDGLAVADVRQPDDPEHFFDSALPFGARHAFHAEAVPDVLRDRHVWEQRVVLEDGVDVALIRRAVGDVDAGELNPSCVRALEACDEAKRCGLAGAGGPEEREEFPGRDLEVDVVDRNDVVVRLPESG
jgi:hypothetical protein